MERGPSPPSFPVAPLSPPPSYLALAIAIGTAQSSLPGVRIQRHASLLVAPVKFARHQRISFAVAEREGTESVLQRRLPNLAQAALRPLREIFSGLVPS